MTDRLTTDQRSYCMSRVKNKGTDIEVRVATALEVRGLNFVQQVKDLPGRPDIAFPEAKVAVFVDGDFWHGWRFRQWRDSVSPFWQQKIGKNRARDCRNFMKLRHMGWRVVRVWQHSIERNLDTEIRRIIQAIASR